MAPLADLRKEYALAGLSETDLPTDPFQQFDRWFNEAKNAGVLEPNAMTLATVTAAGTPAARTVLLKAFDEAGFVFFTNYESAKAADLAAHPHATLLFPWLALERQVIITGTVTKVSRDETAAYFASRPLGSQLGAWASPQSQPVPDRATLEENLRIVSARFADQPVPPPPHWGGYRVTPTQIDFWQGRPSRLHDRLRYERTAGDWTIQRIAP